MNRSILIVEDDPEVRAVMVDLLVEHGLRVYAASHGAEALAWLRQGHTRPSVILLDLGMPVVDGATCLAELAADRLLRTIPVVVVTAQDRLPSAILATGCTVLTKPVEVAALLDTVAHAAAA